MKIDHETGRILPPRWSLAPIFHQAEEDVLCEQLDLERQIQALPPHLRRVAELLLSGVGEREIAQRLGVSRGRVVHWVGILTRSLQRDLTA